MGSEGKDRGVVRGIQGGSEWGERDQRRVRGVKGDSGVMRGEVGWDATLHDVLLVHKV